MTEEKAHKWGHKQTEETKAKISAGLRSSEKSQKYWKEKKGTKLSEEHKRKISLAGIGRKASEETKRKNSEAKKGNKYALGVKRSEEFKKNISLTRSGENNPLFGKRGKDSPNYGRKRSNEGRQNMSKAQCKAILNNNGVSPAFTNSHKGVFYSEKNKKEIKYESSFELQAIQILEKQDNVLLYDRCGFYVKYKLGNSSRRYIPDLYVVYTDKPIEIIEVKPLWALASEMNIAKFKAAEEYCNKRALLFKVWTEKEMEKL